jgi:mono/diheme cytochrome c family protein
MGTALENAIFKPSQRPQKLAQLGLFMLAFVSLGIYGPAHAQKAGEATRGELLYSTHCISCHSSQLHWRDNKVATNWVSLRSQVERWQKTSGLAWPDEDVTEVARYLNALYYRFPVPEALPSSTAKAGPQ